jgi:hypothetical protein
MTYKINKFGEIIRDDYVPDDIKIKNPRGRQKGVKKALDAARAKIKTGHSKTSIVDLIKKAKESVKV